MSIAPTCCSVRFPPSIPLQCPGLDTAGAETGLNIQLKVVYGISIPVIVRQGQTTAQVSITDLHVESKPGVGTPQALTFQLKRAGNRSVYGDCDVTFAPDGAKGEPVGDMKGLAVYTPNAERTVHIPLAVGSGQTAGLFTVVYKERAEDGGAVLASASVQAAH